MKKSLEKVKKYLSSSYTKVGRMEKLKSEEGFKFGLFNCAVCQFSNNTWLRVFIQWNLDLTNLYITKSSI